MASEPVVGLYYFVNTEKVMIWVPSKKNWISYDAMSGGGRGVFDRAHHITNPYGEHLERWLGDRDFHQREDDKHGIRGGPIPFGQYFVGKPAHHGHLGYAAALLPDTATRALLSSLHRGGFFIHGRGKRGSDGCIVPIGIRIADFLAIVEAQRSVWGDRVLLKVLPGEAVNRLQDLPALGAVPG